MKNLGLWLASITCLVGLPAMTASPASADSAWVMRCTHVKAPTEWASISEAGFACIWAARIDIENYNGSYWGKVDPTCTLEKRQSGLRGWDVLRACRR
jgi:hypothetical protein